MLQNVIYCVAEFRFRKDDSLHYLKTEKSNAKRIPAIILSMVLLFTTVLSASMITSSAASFSPRFSAPSYDNQYYYSSKNIFYSAGYGMPNCTAYAFGRAYEILGTEPNLSHGNAQDWYGYNQATGAYSYGSTPQVGAIACWSYNGGGHVAVVESIDNGVVTLSNSAWASTNFYLTYDSVSNPGSSGNSWWHFQGFIYLLNNSGDSGNSGDSDPIGKGDEPSVKPTDDYSTGTYQVNVDSTLNMRSGAGTNTGWVASVPNGTMLNITQIDSDSNYVWGYSTYNGVSGWVALEYCNYIGNTPAQDPTEASEDVEETTSEVVEDTTSAPEESATDPTQEATEEVTEASTAPQEDKANYVLYFAYNDSEETGVYPLQSADQTATVELKAGEYSIFMKADNQTISSTYTLKLETTSEVSVAYDAANDYFDIHVTAIEETPSTENTSPTAETEATTATVNSVSTADTATNDSASANTGSNSTSGNASATGSNGNVQTGGNVQVEAMLLLTFSVSSLAVLWFKRRLFF